MGKRTGKKMKTFSCSCVHSSYENECEKVNSHGRGGRGGGLLNDVTNTKYFSLSISSEENFPTRKKGSRDLPFILPLGRFSAV